MKMFGDFLHNILDFSKNFVKMIADGIMSGVHQVEDAAKSVVNKVKGFLGFGSPTEEGPGADSDNWAPNFVNMFAGGLANGAAQVASTAKSLMDPFKSAVSGLSGGVNIGANVSSSSSHNATTTFGFGAMPALSMMQPVSAGGGGTVNNYVTVNANGNIVEDEHRLGNIVSRALLDKMKLQGKLG